MPLILPQGLKSIATINAQPKHPSSRIQLIVSLDICGKNNNEIAEEVGMTAARVSVIKGSPLYQQERQRLWHKLKEEVVDKKTDAIVAGDPVESFLKENALKAARTKVHLMETSISDVVKSGAATDILDRAGYKPFVSKTAVTVEVTDKMANRWTRALEYNERTNQLLGSKEGVSDASGHDPDDRKTTIRIEEEVS